MFQFWVVEFSYFISLLLITCGHLLLQADVPAVIHKLPFPYIVTTSFSLLVLEDAWLLSWSANQRNLLYLALSCACVGFHHFPPLCGLLSFLSSNILFAFPEKACFNWGNPPIPSVFPSNLIHLLRVSFIMLFISSVCARVRHYLRGSPVIIFFKLGSLRPIRILFLEVSPIKEMKYSTDSNKVFYY